MTYNDYDAFADVYNRHWGSFGVRVIEILDPLGLVEMEPGDTILDLCCGTGQLAGQLTERGLSVIGVDGSAAMIAHARRNAPDAEFLVGDATEFTLDRSVAMAVSTFDSLNHVMTPAGLEEVFRRVAVVLEPGGRFVFDLNVEPGYLARWHGAFVMDEPGEFIVGQSSYDAEERVGTMAFTWFTEHSGHWQRNAAELTQRCYEIGEVVEVLVRAGFVDVATEEAADIVPGWQTGRVFFSAIKPQG